MFLWCWLAWERIGDVWKLFEEIWPYGNGKKAIELPSYLDDWKKSCEDSVAFHPQIPKSPSPSQPNFTLIFRSKIRCTSLSESEHSYPGQRSPHTASIKGPHEPMAPKYGITSANNPKMMPIAPTTWWQLVRS